MRPIRALTLVAGAFMLVPVALPAQAAPEASVQASSFLFCAPGEIQCSPLQSNPYTLTVKAGTIVTWIYNDLTCDVIVPCPGHNVAFKGSAVPKLVKGSALPVGTNKAVLLKRQFKKPGTYTYVCTPHEGQGMTGTVVVTK